MQVIIVGGGLAGLSAAHYSLELGGKIVLLEKNAFCGGNSTKATSGINGALTRTQETLNIQDTVQSFHQDSFNSATTVPKESKLPPELDFPINHTNEEQAAKMCKILTQESAQTLHWLMDKFQIDLSKISRLGSHQNPRTHRGNEKFPGMMIIMGLLRKLEEIQKESEGKWARIITKAKVYKLLTNTKNDVIGVKYEKDKQDYEEYGKVILTCGGFAADFSNASLMKKYRPDLDGFPTTSGNYCTGDGIKIAESIGARLIDMDQVQLHPTGFIDPSDPNAKLKFLAAEALRGVGGILVNNYGERFCDELGRRDYVSGKIANTTEPIWLILNTKCCNELIWHIEHYQERGLMKIYNNSNEFCQKTGINPELLYQTYNQYNQSAQKGTDEFGKRFFNNTPYEMNDKIAVSQVCRVVHYCMGGVQINENAEVLDNYQQPINGLYGAGECTGGVHGKNRLGGNSLLDCAVFGRIAAKSAMQQLVKQAFQRKEIKLLKFTIDEVGKHNQENDFYCVIDGNVYDVTKFVKYHPGGVESLMKFAGKECTKAFDMLHFKDVLTDPQYKVKLVGVLANSDNPNAPKAKL